MDMPRIGALGHPLTREQERIIAQPPTETFKCMAFAGCAKTTTSVEYAHVHPETALYLAFNAAIAGDAKGRFPRHVHTQTAHGYAFNRMGVRQYDDRLVPRLRPEHLRGLQVRPIANMTPLAVQRAIIKAVNAYVISGDSRVTDKHLSGFPWASRGTCVSMVQAVVDRMLDFENSGLPFTHDVYLKAFAERGQISEQFDYVIVDEAQDLNPVLIEIVQKSSRPSIVIGDPWQCLPPGEMVLCPDGERPIEAIRVGDLVMASWNGTLKPAKVLRVHESIKKTGLVTITTASGASIRSTPEHTHFAGYEGNGCETGWCVYLMYRKDMGWRIGTANDSAHSLPGNVRKGYAGRANQEGADMAFVLATFADEEGAALQEAVWSLRYSIPTATFRYRGGRSEAYYRELFRLVDGREGAARLLDDLGMDIASPHYRPKGMRRGRLNFSITLCAQGGLHRYCMSGSDQADAESLVAAGIRTRGSKHGGWRIESMTSDLGSIYALYERVREVSPHVNLIEKAMLGEGKALSFTSAGNCVPGMTIFRHDPETGGIVRDRIASVHRESYEGPVHDIDVEGVHNYVANGIVTHNSIYAFRGAHQALDHFRGPRYTLSQSFRFGPRVAAVANHILKQSTTPPDTPIQGNPTKDTKVQEYTGSVKGRATILARTNMRLFESLVKITGTFHVVGGIEEMIDQATAGHELWRQRTAEKVDRSRIRNPLVARHNTWADLVESSELDEDPETIRLVKIVDGFGDKVPEILADLRRRHRSNEDEARFIVSTAHKAKGREWDHVVVLDDFPTMFKLRQWLGRKRIERHEYDQEINLLYVTMTRAIETLSISTDLYDEIASGTGLIRY